MRYSRGDVILAADFQPALTFATALLLAAAKAWA
jgi:hypothetical protein